MTDRLAVDLHVNGHTVHAEVEPRRLLADFLRDDLGLTGTHLGCEHGVCGACTVLLDGAAVRSCTTLAVQADGAEVTTIEGLTPAEGLSLIQAAFVEQHALQCGFCTPGFVVTVDELLRENDDPSDEEIREAISGNLCRCTGYASVVDAVRAAAAAVRAQRKLGTA